jgi:SAM-dependent methyltransferase
VRAQVPSAATLLDVGCGTGRHLVEFTAAGFDCVGVDASPEMLTTARARVGDTSLVEGDLRGFDLGARFDVVVCLNGTIGYMTTSADLVDAIGNLARHVGDGGLLLVEPWFAPAQWLAPMVTAESAKDGDVAVARVSRAIEEDGMGMFERLCTIATPDRTWSFTEVHRLGLYELDEYLAAFETAGLSAVHESLAPGRGLGILNGRRPPASLPS